MSTAKGESTDSEVDMDKGGEGDSADSEGEGDPETEKEDPDKEDDAEGSTPTADCSTCGKPKQPENNVYMFGTHCPKGRGQACSGRRSSSTSRTSRKAGSQEGR